ncbi:hypothetical protein C6497_12560 [Candidatus Poribacteria bacterium]|nr:MAG: hypothetical protein C6497_12560 [Candidatus Poribacteria bacterium]
MSAEKDLQKTQQIAELEESIYKIQVAITKKTEMKSRLETINTSCQINKFKTEAETKFKDSINQIQKVIDEKKSEQEILQNQIHDATSREKKEWLNERITNLQEFITQLEEGRIKRQNNLTEMGQVISQLNQDFVSRKNTVADLDNEILCLEQDLKDKQNALLGLKNIHTIDSFTSI